MARIRLPPVKTSTGKEDTMSSQFASQIGRTVTSSFTAMIVAVGTVAAMAAPAQAAPAQQEQACTQDNPCPAPKPTPMVVMMPFEPEFNPEFCFNDQMDCSPKPPNDGIGDLKTCIPPLHGPNPCKKVEPEPEPDPQDEDQDQPQLEEPELEPNGQSNDDSQPQASGGNKPSGGNTSGGGGSQPQSSASQAIQQDSSSSVGETSDPPAQAQPAVPTRYSDAGPGWQVGAVIGALGALALVFLVLWRRKNRDEEGEEQVSA